MVGHTSFHGGSSHPVTVGAVYRGSVKTVMANGLLNITIPRLGYQHFYKCDALRGPETNPYVKGDQILCVFLNNQLSELFVLGRFDHKRETAGNQTYESLIEDVVALTADVVALTARVATLEGTSHSH